jgi:hypothetical protein
MEKEKRKKKQEKEIPKERCPVNRRTPPYLRESLLKSQKEPPFKLEYDLVTHHRTIRAGCYFRN